MQKTDTNPRREFLKMIPVALVSLGSFSFFKLKKASAISEKKFDTLSKPEADEIIKNEKFIVSSNLKPAPAPVGQKNIMG